MTTTAFTATEITFCTTCDSVDDCTGIHEGDADFQLPKRFAFWEKADRKGTYYATWSFENFVVELTDMADGAPFVPGEAVVRDLATKTTMDAAEFLAGRA